MGWQDIVIPHDLDGRKSTSSMCLFARIDIELAIIALSCVRYVNKQSG